LKSIRDGARPDWQVLGRDLTGLKAELFTVLSDLSESSRETERRISSAADEAKMRFLANISHEIRTPLNSILGFTELIVDPELPPADKIKSAAAVRRNGIQLLEVVDEILEIAKIEGGCLKTDKVEFPLLDLLSEIKAIMAVEAGKKGIDLLFQYDSRMPLRIVSDPVRLKQILINIVGNALKFTERGSVRVRGEFAGQRGDFFLRFEVTDTGVGIDSETAAVLFRPFSQIDASHTRPHGGAGLGLALSRGLARALGGDVRLSQSRLGEGSRFLVEVKVDIPAAEEWRRETDVTSVPVAPPLQGRRILLVEDLEDNRFLISQYLCRAGAAVEMAANGLEGVEMALAGAYDVILMDIQMPKLDGYQATARLRDAGYTRPIVALTAHALLEEREKCLRIGCNDHLTKPINRQRLIDSLLALTRS
jgi:signal transduction histidine kinase/CheY-like chemotaxis protein